MQNIKKTVWMHKKKIYWLFGLTLILGLAIVAQAYVMTSIVDGVFLKNSRFQRLYRG
ncbi:hypothetical protein AAHH67_07425 [Niallia circulans]